VDTGEPVADPEEQNGKVDETYRTDPKDVDGYTYVDVEGEPEGRILLEETEVIFYYKLNTKVTIKYIDINTGEEIDDRLCIGNDYDEDEEEVKDSTIEINGLLGDEFETKVKAFDGYKLVEEPDEIPEKMTKEEIVLIYKYVHVSEGIIERHIDTITKKLLEPETLHEGDEGDSYKIDSKELIDSMNTARKGHDVYMIGNSTSGKTSIINRAMKGFENKTTRQIKTITYPGTSVNVLEIPLSRSSFFYELPGISQTTSATGKLEKDVVRQIVPKKAVKFITRTMSAGDALMVGSLAAFEIIKGKTTNYRFYSAEGVETRKVQSKKLDDYINENNIRRFARPVSERLVSFLDYDMFEYAMENDKKWHDIAIEGLGWLSFIAQGQMIRVRLPKGVALKESIAKIK
jgi:ribosome biogenesis GTPase A